MTDHDETTPASHDDEKPYDAFEDLTRKLLKVPKEEVDEKRRAEKTT